MNAALFCVDSYPHPYLIQTPETKLKTLTWIYAHLFDYKKLGLQYELNVVHKMHEIYTYIMKFT